MDQVKSSINRDILQKLIHSLDITAYGPITQKDFLQSLGIQARIETLFRNAKTSAARKSLLDGAERLMDPEAMGRIYKVLAFANSAGHSKEPVGFEKK